MYVTKQKYELKVESSVTLVSRTFHRERFIKTEV